MSFVAGIFDSQQCIQLSKSIELVRRSCHLNSGKLFVAAFPNILICSQQNLNFLPRTQRCLSVNGFVNSSLKDLDTLDGESLLTKTSLEGDFAISYSDASNFLILRRDILGAVPLYYSFSGSKVIWSSSLKTVLALREGTPAIDEGGLYDLLNPQGRSTDKFFRTAFNGIFNLEPGHALKFTAETVKKTKVEGFRISSHFKKVNYSEVCEEFRYLLRRSIINKSQGEKFAVTNGDEAASAIGFIANYLATNQKIDPPECLDSGGLSPLSIEDQMWITEVPFVDFCWSNISQVARERGCKTIMTAKWGHSFLGADDYLVDFFWLGKWIDLKDHVEQSCKDLSFQDRRRYQRDLLRRFLISSLPLSAHLRSILSSKVTEPRMEGSFQQQSISGHIKSKYNQARNASLYKTSMRYGVRTSAPFLEKNLVQFFLDLPPEFYGSFQKLVSESTPNFGIKSYQENTRQASDHQAEVELFRRVFTTQFQRRLETADKTSVSFEIVNEDRPIPYSNAVPVNLSFV